MDRTTATNASDSMALGEPLLTTKLRVPRPRPNLVLRRRLTERLNEATKGKLTLVSAPAGFGKTTLLGEWSFKSELPVMWISLDEGDNDLTRFLAYFVAALESLQAGVGEGTLALLRSPQPPPIESVLTALINEIAAIPNEFVLVLDDYHLIEAQPIHEAVAFLLDHLPPQAHLVIASRTDPPLPLARLLAGGHLTKLSADDLRFTPQEAAAFLNEVMGLNLSVEDVGALEERTEGWIAGLQLAALSMQGREDIPGFIAAFAGSHRYVLDYLAEEVFDKQPEGVRSFLLETSVLDRLSGPLGDAVTGRSGSQGTLEALERANLFLVPLDDERRWYRYHHLFSDFLSKELRRSHPERVPDLHLRACEWYERNGLLTEAVGHAFKAGDFERAAGLIDRVARPMLMRREATTLLGWLEALPERLIRSRPQLCLAYAATFLSLGRLDAGIPYLRDAERLLGLDDGTAEASTNSPEPGEDKEVANLRGEALAIHAHITSFQEDWHQTIAFSRRALELLNEDNLFSRSFVVTAMAMAYLGSGDMEAASQAFTEALAISQAINAPSVTVATIYNLAHLRMIQGRLREAEETYGQCLQVAEHSERPLSRETASVTYMGIGEVLRERNDLENAARYLLKGIELYEQSMGINIDSFHGYVALVRTKQAQGAREAALDALQKLKQFARWDSGTTIRRWVAAWQARWWIAQGNLVAATRWAEESGLSAEDEPNYPREFEHITLARLLIVQGEHQKAAGLLERLLEAAEAGGRMGTVIEILALKALALQAQKDTPNALAALQRALSLAEPEGYVRTFVDEDEPMAALLKRLLKDHKRLRADAEPLVSPEYVCRLLEALGHDVTTPTKVRARGRASLLVEPLSERELEVLRLLSSDFSNQEIAAKLYVSLDTVKSHLKHIYGKLGVRSRHQAVDRAREFDLLQ